MTVRVVRLGEPRVRGEGTRIGTVRRPPRGVPKTEFASGNWYDVWLPNLAPAADNGVRLNANFAKLRRCSGNERRSPRNVLIH